MFACTAADVFFDTLSVLLCSCTGTQEMLALMEAEAVVSVLIAQACRLLLWRVTNNNPLRWKKNSSDQPGCSCYPNMFNSFAVFSSTYCSAPSGKKASPGPDLSFPLQASFTYRLGNVLVFPVSKLLQLPDTNKIGALINRYKNTASTGDHEAEKAWSSTKMSQINSILRITHNAFLGNIDHVIRPSQLWLLFIHLYFPQRFYDLTD